MIRRAAPVGGEKPEMRRRAFITLLGGVAALVRTVQLLFYTSSNGGGRLEGIWTPTCPATCSFARQEMIVAFMNLLRGVFSLKTLATRSAITRPHSCCDPP